MRRGEGCCARRAVSMIVAAAPIDGVASSRGCAECGNAIVRSTDRGRPRRFCSGRCRTQYWNRQLRNAAMDANSAQRAASRCVECASPVERGTWRGAPKHCSDRCRRKYAQRLGKQRRAQNKPVRDCAGCGTAHRRTKYCSHTCMVSTNARIFQARNRPGLTTLTSERVDPFVVFSRDGWRCYICGEETPKLLRGTSEPRAPQIDHIIPLSSGGAHSYDNTACACRQCNLAKGSTLVLSEPLPPRIAGPLFKAVMKALPMPPNARQFSRSGSNRAPWESTRGQSRQARGYGRAHEKMRAVVLDEEPLCRPCLSAGLSTPAVIADHIIPKAEGGDDARTNYQGICKDCHDLKTEAERLRACGSARVRRAVGIDGWPEEI